MTKSLYELIWMKHFLEELKLIKVQQMQLIRNNQAPLDIPSNLVFHERNKHIEITAISFERNFFKGRFGHFPRELANPQRTKKSCWCTVELENISNLAKSEKVKLVFCQENWQIVDVL